MKTVMIFGYGSAGQYLVDFLSKDTRISEEFRICIVSRKKKEEVQPRIEITKVAAGISERFIKIDYFTCDFNDIDRMADLISLATPDVIVYTGRFASGIKYGSLSYPNGIGYGVWIPLSFVYIYKLMIAVKISGVETKVINTSFPDGVNCLLDTVGLAPYCGAGNLNHLAPRIKRAFYETYHVKPEDLEVDLTCGHYVNTYLSKEGSPRGGHFNLTVISKSRPVSDDYNDLFCYVNDSYRFNINHTTKSKEVFDFLERIKDTTASGPIRNQMIATDCNEIVRYLIDPSSEGIIRIPGYMGSPGGTTYKAFEGEFIRCTSTSRRDEEEINRQNLLKDGIEIVEGGVKFTEESRQKMKECFDIDYPEVVNIEDLEDFASQIKDYIQEG